MSPSRFGSRQPLPAPEPACALSGHAGAGASARRSGGPRRSGREGARGQDRWRHGFSPGRFGVY